MTQELKSTLLYAIAIAIKEEDDKEALMCLMGAEEALLQ
jgi:hypothetical protein